MKVATALCFLLVTCNLSHAVEKPKGSRLTTVERIAVYASSQFDAATTYHAIRSCPPGYICREGNPSMRPFAGNVSIFPVMAGSAWAVDYVSRKISPNHPKLARTVRWITIGGHMVAGFHNLRH